MKTYTDEQLIDFVSGELPTALHREIEGARTQVPGLANRIAEVEDLRRSIQQDDDDQASPTADARFYAYLERLEDFGGTVVPEVRTVRSLLPSQGKRRRATYFFAAAATILLVFSVGWSLGHYYGTSDVDRELAANRALVLELVKRPGSSDRIRAVTVSLSLPTADPVVIDHLGHLLQTDENANVRLAALDALLRFSHLGTVRQLLLDALASDPPEVVRIELMETLIGLEERRVLPYLEDIIRNDTLPKPLRDAAEHGAYRLI